MIPEIDMELLERYIDGRLTDLDADRLRRLLRESAEARALLRSLATVEFGLQDLAATVDTSETVQDQSRQAMGRSWTRWPRRLAAAAAILAMIAGAYSLQPRGEPEIARISGLSGSVLWTGNGGQITSDPRVGQALTGGTIEGMTPNSWVKLDFLDGSTVTISGISTLTFSDRGQKELRLKEGSLSGDVNPQSPGKPMRVQARSALMEVLGTRFKVETEPGSTVLNVEEGKVRVSRLADGQAVDVPARHRLVATADRDMSPEAIPGSVPLWKSQVSLGPMGSWGRWSPRTDAGPATLRAVPYSHVSPEGQAMTLYSAALRVSGGDDTPVIPDSHARIRIQGRLATAHDLVFGVTVRRSDGEFAGNFFTIKPTPTFGAGGDFEVLLDLGEFQPTPPLIAQKGEPAGVPVGAVLDWFWCNSLADPVGLEILEVEILSPSPIAP